MYCGMLGRVPSRSVKPYSSASAHDEKMPPLFRIRFGSAASAATPRPTKRGVSETVIINEQTFIINDRSFIIDLVTFDLRLATV